MAGQAEVAQDGQRMDMRQRERTMTQKARRFIAALPDRVRRHGIKVLSFAAWAAVFGWESRNGANGFQQEFNPGIGWAIVGALGLSATSNLSWFWAMRDMRLIAKSPDKVFSALGSFVVSMLATAGLLYGVWSNFAADGIRRGDESEDQKARRGSIVKDMRSLEADLRLLPQTIDLGLAADRESLKKVQNIARQWDLPKLDNNPGGDCDADLKTYPRSLCNQAADLRSDIANAESSIAKRDVINAAWAKKDAELKTMDAAKVRGVEQYDQISETTGWNRNLIQSIVKLALSFVFLLLGMYLFERTFQGQGRGKQTGG